MSKFFDSPEMRQTLRRILRSQMAAKGVDYKMLSERLTAMGIEQKESNLRSKITTGALGAQLFIYIEMALNVKSLDMDFLTEILEDVRQTEQDDSDSED